MCCTTVSRNTHTASNRSVNVTPIFCKSLITRNENLLNSAYPILLPLQPCDEEWGENEAYKKECQDQAIVRQRTKYTWEMSVIRNDTNNAGEFLPLRFENILAPPDQRYLPPVHMLPNRYVRCRATAVSSNDIEGYTRVSQPVRLVRSDLEACPVAKASVVATLAPAGDEVTGLEVGRHTTLDCALRKCWLLL